MSLPSVLDVEIVESLSCRPTSSVFRCRDQATNLSVILKQVSLPDPQNPVDHEMENAQQELKVAKILERKGGHPHVMAYDAAFVHEGHLYLLMDDCANGDFFTFLESQPDHRLPEPLALRLWSELVQGVHFLHQNDIAHRDVSLENALLTSQYHVKVCDFGLSTFTTKNQLSSGRVGKAYYMAPEVVIGDAYDAKLADIWSLGISLFILLTGSPLYQVASPSDPRYDVIRRLGINGILNQWHMRHLVSAETIQLLTQLLQTDPKQRLDSTQALLAHMAAHEG
ncbi:hypothetical protein Poli38472_011772 [Pythium oligandrum]|uniref:Protein kinase domain-containing protein n=1 Tax=Pythium oligandrum TaxID=41045 RepID=A0A8K1FEQ2_PYTOL|nr:hypothetical protein Poli38472_011772 [Pythium oligandrum]|eukprot:TMW58184.1 hypothetical protein Poli38472_011772 [Pythium oligandrum]